MADASPALTNPHLPAYDRAFRVRRFLNWFPMGLTYAFLYMGRYNLTVAKNALGALFSQEAYGRVSSAGTVTYGLAFVIVGPLTEKIGGKRALLIAAYGAGLINLLMGGYLHVALSPGGDPHSLPGAFLWLYAANMFFQSFGAVSIVKVNSQWFHVRERGSFSGIFGVMISSGLFFAFTVNGWLLDFALAHAADADSRALQTQWVFFAPAAVLLASAVVETFLLRDRPVEAGLADFDTGDVDVAPGADVSALGVFRRLLSHPVLLTVAFIEFCTGVLRNGVLQWFPIYIKQVPALPKTHFLNLGSWGAWYTIWPFFALGALLFAFGARAPRPGRSYLFVAGGLAALVPFLQAGWGGLQMVAGVIGGIVAGYVSDFFFQSRRAPAAGGLYAVLLVCAVAMVPALGAVTPVIEATKIDFLEAGDRITSVAGTPVHDWVEARRAFVCVPAPCLDGASFDTSDCLCAGHPKVPAATPVSTGTIDVIVERKGAPVSVTLADPALRKVPVGAPQPKLHPGDQRAFDASPVMSVSPYVLGILGFLMSLSVIGIHGLLSGTATMDFGGKKGTATAVGMIDGFVYLGTGLQYLCLGSLTSRSWSYWPLFLIPFALIGLLLCVRIWNAKPATKVVH